ncbi:MAG: phosphonate ABC transporter ATP-binding protein [Bacteroidetes bacterium RIFOXYB2_FULL_35_7]|nr:MAG: phosphonate ABC transporter ATP-binding protein [Bacteroidetes bacterium GWF2_35_48]OFY93286.1 MAG: phosphonate ABC transporter ATP-binding protein [Bacteroidetes bacterium RIFOXYB2_FULL_35_7]OFY96485.1 MAG: phosphonate ABC transporter ATP-binding protein [Bacteroidetes bacterium RIFOXYC12_FULL_35_7]
MSEPIINLQNVSIYQQDNLILSNIDFSVSMGEFVYLIGKVGSGKTSLIKALYAGIPLAEGNGSVVSFDLNKITQKEIPFLRRKIGIVFQDFQLLTDRTVRNNLVYVLRATEWNDKEKIAQRINEVLEKVGLPDKIDKMPHQLSGGEQQRIVIARALLNEPELILADEPTGNLDPETSDEIMNLLMSIKNNGNTIVMATHNYYLLKKYQGRVIKCENSKLTEFDDNIAAIDFSALE